MSLAARVRPAAALVWAAAMALIPPGAAVGQPAPRVPVIIDTDIGDDIDDAFALVVALSDPRLELIGVTTAWGDTRERVLLVRRLLAAMNRGEVVVAEGRATPDSVPFTQRRWAEGAIDRSPAPDAIDFICAEVDRRPGQITLIELAPPANIQALMRRDIEAFDKLKQIVVMGGSIRAGYDRGGAIPVAEPSAEYNVASAPDAFAAVLSADGAVPIRLFPLDATQIKFDEVRRDRLFAYGSPATDALTLLYHQWRLFNGWGQITPTLFDVAPVAWVIDPAICALTPLRIAVDAAGFTRAVPGPPNADVCLSPPETAVEARVLHDLAPEPPNPSR